MHVRCRHVRVICLAGHTNGGKAMRLYRTAPLFDDIHRSGWPYAFKYLQEAATGKGLWVDDFADATIRYRPQGAPHEEPWVGIFHHPVDIHSPLTSDRGYRLGGMTSTRVWKQSVDNLRGVIALCPDVAKWFHEALPHIPTLVLKHPSEVPELKWQAPMWPNVWQTGFFIRDTQFVDHLPTVRPRFKSMPHLDWQRHRESQLKKYHAKKQHTNYGSIPVERVSNDVYDLMMSTYVVCMHLFAAAANNVVVECIARNTPLLVNDLPATRYYLGSDYPLFFTADAFGKCDYVKTATLVNDRDRVYAAHEHLKALEKHWLRGDVFAKDVAYFVDEVL